MTRREPLIVGSFHKRWRDRLAVALIVLVCAAVAHAAGARDSTTVTFQSVDRVDPREISAELFVPDGDGPFPALVLLHGSGGIGEFYDKWAVRFQAMGYVALVVDTLGSRGMEWHPGGTYYYLQTADAYGALGFLRSHSLADADRIAAVGWSHGGRTAVRAAQVNPGASQIFPRRIGRFGAAVAFYPYCGETDVYDIPLLILIGEADDWTSANLCVGAMRAAEQMGSPVDVDLVVYPGATHGFDNVDAGDTAQVAAWAAEYPDIDAVPGGLRYLGHLIKYDAKATADAIKRVEAFLAEHLGRASID